MYSPKIKESLVKRLYRLKLATGKPMTKLVNELLARPIEKMENKVNNNREAKA